MGLTKIKVANKKWKHEAKRKLKRLQVRREAMAVKKNRKAAIVTRRAQLIRREADKAYVKQLTEEIEGKE